MDQFPSDEDAIRAADAPPLFAASSQAVTPIGEGLLEEPEGLMNMDAMAKARSTDERSKTMQFKKRVIFQVDRVDTKNSFDSQNKAQEEDKANEQDEEVSEESDDFDIYGNKVKRRFSPAVREQLFCQPVKSKSGYNMQVAIQENQNTFKKSNSLTSTVKKKLECDAKSMTKRNLSKDDFRYAYSFSSFSSSDSEEE